MQGAVIYLLQKEKLNHSLRGVIQFLREKTKASFCKYCCQRPEKEWRANGGNARKLLAKLTESPIFYPKKEYLPNHYNGLLGNGCLLKKIR
ncbi:hypothetical protein [Pseudoalteromonas spongiae]|uniref:hypothetical protein n=1 Tax=Pseudoalteromonas spongiae TaxID=298657 RepID=UPI00127C20D8|nr:hypothetical protein [Pseudoalteromonas spongiae]TMO84218.1 hypothetical protein CWC15_11470 [Pseudoalteromonas spongiae]